MIVIGNSVNGHNDNMNHTSQFEQYYEDQSRLPVKNKVKLIIACCFAGSIPNFAENDLKKDPFQSGNLTQTKPTVETVKTELERRDPDIRGLSKKKVKDLILLLKDRNYVLSDGCIAFIQKEFGSINDSL